MTSLLRTVEALLVATAIAAVLWLLLVLVGRPDASIALAWAPVVVFYALPVLIVGYVIGLLRNIAADGRASRGHLEGTRRELEAIRRELAHRDRQAPSP